MRLADPALAIELVASEPAIVSPVAMAWDEFGRLFVVEMTDYPTALTGGRVKRLEDRDGDGRYEHATVFAENLHYPSGVMAWNGGVLVTAAPDLLYFKDNDGDGKADVRKVILTGFGEGNQQLRVNSPSWGLDNWVYLANGRSGGAIRRPEDPPSKAVSIPRNDLRVKPGTGAFEPVAGFSQFGLPRDDWGDRFPSWNTVPLRHIVLEDRPLSRNPSPAEILDLSDGGRIYSLAPSQRRFNAETVAFFNATCGPTIYRGDLLGANYGGHAFVCEPLGSVVHHRRLDPEGPTFVARRVEQGREFVASTHPWFRPVNLATGPDGALYLADFCRAWVEHPAFVPENLRQSVDFREGHERGRIWRIAPRESSGKDEHRPHLPLKAETSGLVAMLADPNGWCRDTAQRLLVERQDKNAVGPLRTLAKASPSPLGRVHALWTLDGLGSLDPETLRAGLRADDPHVREQAARLTMSQAAEYVPELATLADDRDVRVRLRAAVALAGVDTDSAREALARIAARDGDSPWAASAILGGVGENPSRFLDTLADRQPAWLNAPTSAQARFLTRLAALIGERNDGPEIETLLDRVAGTPGEPAAFALLQGLSQGQVRLKTPRLDWTGAGVKKVEPVLAAAGPAASDPSRPAWVRGLALELLLAVRPAASRPLLAALLEPDQPTELQAVAAHGVARAADPTLVATLFEGWDRYALAARRVMIGGFASTTDLAGRLLTAVEKGEVPAVEVDPATREALRLLPDPKFHTRVEALFPTSTNADRRDVIRRYEPALSLSGDASRGRALFGKNCQTCHARNGQGAKVGPDLISVAGRPAADLLVAILDPAREAAPDGLGVIVVTTLGQTLTGLLAEETPAAIRLRRAEGVEDVIPRGEIEALRPTGRSLMPDGLEQVLTPQEIADVIAFLRSAPDAAP